MSGVSFFGQLALREFLGEASFNKLTSKTIFRLPFFPNMFEFGIFEGFFKVLAERICFHVNEIISYKIYYSMT